MQKIVLIVAGGSGSRMQTEIPKQFLPIAQKPILMHTIEAFYRYDRCLKIILVLPENYVNFWKKLCEKYQFNALHQIVIGGATRVLSVKNGIEAIKTTEEAVVAIHDSVRPFVSTAIIKQNFEMAQKLGSAVTCIPLKDSIRMLKENGQSEALDRTQFRLVQTPQTFWLSVLRKAYQQSDIQHLTDDASVVQKIGFPIHLVEGNPQNIKITTPEDLWIAETLCQKLNLTQTL
ncbi:MAG: 2-C-methyl-D-erythritol 4-phosphate cytidylyltransferase [Microscillaceae bacterium]|nr:2-C-methyl-D-erythritol 4-phosphate cytidylyltransferase [Microscillaceae bacterium]MDW8459905.1 2-C-methyl-D-erythritol 4-phosphate cytidylyltransferase [Cytophagales bacterium]